MVTSAALHDAIAAKLVEISGVKVAFADGSTGTLNVLPWTPQVTTMPAVVVMPADTGRDANMGRQHYARSWEADFYISAVEPGPAMQWINALHDLVLTTAQENYTLDRAVSILNFLGARKPAYREEGQDEGRTPYLVWTTRWATRERVGVFYTPEST